MAERPPDLVSALRDLSLALERFRGAFVRRHGLVGNDSVVLSHLIAAGGRLLPGEIAHAMTLRTGTVTAMLDRLERAGFVARSPNPDDRRSTFIDLTDAGRTALDEYQRHLELALRTALPAKERQSAAHLMSRTAAAIGSSIKTGAADKGAAPTRRTSR